MSNAQVVSQTLKFLFLLLGFVACGPLDRTFEVAPHIMEAECHETGSAAMQIGAVGRVIVYICQLHAPWLWISHISLNQPAQAHDLEGSWINTLQFSDWIHEAVRPQSTKSPWHVKRWRCAWAVAMDVVTLWFLNVFDASLCKSSLPVIAPWLTLPAGASRSSGNRHFCVVPRTQPKLNLKINEIKLRSEERSAENARLKMLDTRKIERERESFLT